MSFMRVTPRLRVNPLDTVNTNMAMLFQIHLLTVDLQSLLNVQLDCLIPVCRQKQLSFEMPNKRVFGALYS
jgi:hypothetical protein